MGLFDSFTVIPSIDLKGGEVVRLLQGDMARVTVYGNDPAATARHFDREGARLIHVVDLDGAIAGEPRNLDSLRAIRAAVQCQIDFSGGLRTMEAIRKAVASGADLVALGSVAFLKPELLRQACNTFPGRVLGSLDIRGGKPAIKGWVETSELGLDEAATRFQQAQVAALVCTDIARDGTEAGINPEYYRDLAGRLPIAVIASGGVASLDDVRALARHFEHGVAGVIIGRALYERKFALAEAITAAGR